MNPFAKGKLRVYLKVPVYLILFMLIAMIVLYLYDTKLGIAGGVFVGIYAICVTFFYMKYQSMMQDEIMRFAMDFGTVESRLLRHIHLPYAILDNDGRFLWMNESFSKMSGKERSYQKSVTGVFKEITREKISKAKKKSFSMTVQRKEKDREKTYRLQLYKLKTDDVFSAEGSFLEVKPDYLVALMVFDETELHEAKTTIEDQRLVTMLIYIDNYEETFEVMEDVKKSMLTAMIDRKIGRYLQNSDAIVRKTDKDKYFVIFRQKYLKALEEKNFSILEEIKTTKAGNENEVTLSIGVGAGASFYNQNVEYSRTAIDLALGRGGSQAVVKNGDEVSYYGVRGKEVERNTRVKARVKAQALREMMETKERVIVMGHQISDADALGAAIGVYTAARVLGKRCQIVLNTITSSLRPLVELFSESKGYPPDMFINSAAALEIANARTLVMVVDTNRPNYTECPQLLKKTKSIVVFDHHRQGNEQIRNPVLSYIEPYASSACEMIAETLQYFSEQMELKPNEADCIYAGILIDTNNFMTKTGVRTFEAAAYLRRMGAEVTRVRKLLREDMATYKARAEVVRNAEVYRSAFAFSVCQTNEVESPTVVGAQAANELLNIVGIKASFVLTGYNNKIYVSSRSIDEIDVQKIMEQLGGGGHLNVAGAQIEGESFDMVRAKIKDIIDALLKKGDIVL